MSQSTTSGSTASVTETATLRVVRMGVDGMDCPECARTLESALRQVPGVSACRVDYGTGLMRGTVDASLPESHLQRAARRAGYRLTDPSHVERWNWRHFAAIGVSILLYALAWTLARYGEPVWSAVVYALVIASAGSRVALMAWQALRQRHSDMNVLMSVAVTGAVALGEWGEAAAVVVLFQVGNRLQQIASDRGRSSLRQLLRAVPETATVIRDGQEVEQALDVLRPGDVVRVRSGARVPVDGVVVAGLSEVDMASITGESLPIPVEPGAHVYAGAINLSGGLDVASTVDASESLAARMVRLMEDAQESRTPIQQPLDRFAGVYTPLVVAGAVLLGVVPSLVTGDWHVWGPRALAMLLIACPCALVLAGPAALVAALGAAARMGALVKSGDILESLARVTHLVLDKTGTITEGKLRVSQVTSMASVPESAWIPMAAAAEAGSEHPIAVALREYCRQMEWVIPESRNPQVHPGVGVSAQVDGRMVTVGRGDQNDAHQQAARVTVRIDGTPVGRLEFVDRLRPDSPTALESLRSMGLRLTLLSGDDAETTARVAQAVGADAWTGGMMPDDKWRAVVALRDQGGLVMMAGDGINDAPALQAADVGVAMGANGTDLAIEAGDVVLMRQGLTPLTPLISLARALRTVIGQNIVFAVGCKLLLMAAAVPGALPLWAAVLGDTGVALLVTLNSLRLLVHRPRTQRSASAI